MNLLATLDFFSCIPTQLDPVVRELGNIECPISAEILEFLNKLGRISNIVPRHKFLGTTVKQVFDN